MSTPEIVSDLALELCCDVVDSRPYHTLQQDMETSGVLAVRQRELQVVRNWEDSFGEAQPQFLPAYVHKLDIRSDEQAALIETYRQITDQNEVRLLHGLVQRVIPSVGQHCVRSMFVAGAMAIRDNRPPEEVRLTMTGMVLHDIGQSDLDMLQVKRSKQTFAENPQLRLAMQRHPFIGVQMAMAAAVDPNVGILIGGHHLAQPAGRGEPYGVLAGEQGFADEHGRRPAIRKLLEYVQVADVLDAIVRPDQAWLADTGRAYRRHESGSYETALQVVDSMPVSDGTKQVAHDLIVKEVLTLPVAA